MKQFFCCIFFTFLVIKTLDPDPNSLEMLAPDPDSMNPDPKHCLKLFLFKHFTQTVSNIRRLNIYLNGVNLITVCACGGGGGGGWV